MRRRKVRTSGMTLIEVMVVMVIMAAIAVAAGMNVMSALEGSRKNDTKTRARTIQHAAMAFLMEDPSTCPGVSDLADGYLDATTDHQDAWGQPFEITCEGSTIHVRSGGPDATLDTDDDIGF